MTDESMRNGMEAIAAMLAGEPMRCTYCDENVVADQGDAYCGDCFETLYGGHKCAACGIVVGPDDADYCADCEASGQAEYDRRDRAGDVSARGMEPSA